MVVATESQNTNKKSKQVIELAEITVRFCGDSGDGMQLAGTQLTNTSAIFGNDVSTLPDFPAEIRAPAGSLAGVSGFQLHFGSQKLRTPGDEVNALIGSGGMGKVYDAAASEGTSFAAWSVKPVARLDLARAFVPLTRPLQRGAAETQSR